MRKKLSYALGLGFVAAFVGCQVIAGLETRSEAPAGAAGGGTSTGGAAGGGGTGGAAGASGAGTGGGKAGAAGATVDPTCGVSIWDADGGALPQPPKTGAGAAGGTTLTFAAKRFYFGAHDPETGLADNMAWQRIGLDLDGVCTTLGPNGMLSPGSCQTAAGNDPNLVDGTGCRDNGVGRFLSGLGPYGNQLEALMANRVELGYPTMLLEIDDVDPGPCDTHAPGKLYVSTRMENFAMPVWDGNDVRQVDARSLEPDAGLDKPRVAFPNGYVTNHVWVSGPLDKSAIQMLIPAQDWVIDVDTRALVVLVQLDPANHDHAIYAVLAAAVDPKPLIDTLTPIVPAFIDGGCSGSLEPFIAQAILALSSYEDLSIDAGIPDGGDGGRFQDPTKPCDGISMGLAMELVAIRPITQTSTTALTPLPCDAGFPDAAGGSGGASGGASGASGKGGGGSAGAAGKTGGTGGVGGSG